MADKSKRDNTYWKQRLEKDGHGDLLARVEAGEITVYKARQLAGYRKAGKSSPVVSLAHHWQRASASERKKFIFEHRHEVNRLLRQMIDDSKSMKAQKPSE